MSTLLISLVQTDLKWEDKAANRQQIEKMIRNRPARSAIVFLPEMFNTGFSMKAPELAESMSGPTVTWMKALSAELKIILAGSLIIEEKDPATGEPAYFNRLLWILPNGQTGTYDKRHLFAYAGEDKPFTQGHRRFIASVNGWRFNLQVCYDLRFPVWARQNASESGDPEYDVLVYLANWPERRIEAWKTLLQARAIENQAYVIGVNRVGTDGEGIAYNGQSMVVNPLGQIVADGGDSDNLFSYELQRSELESIRLKFPFLHDRDHFYIEP